MTALRPLIAPWTAEVADRDLELLRVTEYTFRAQIADRWRRGNVFLLGDAAHLTPPFIGQGMGAGVRDAMNLAWKIAGVRDVTASVDGDWQIFALRVEANTDVREEVYRLASARRWTLRELSQRRATLEDVFVEITHPDAV